MQQSAYCQTFVALIVVFHAAPSLAQMSEESRQMPTDAAATDLFPLNPAVQKPSSLHGGLFFTRNTKKSSLDMTAHGGDSITSKTNDDYANAGMSVDLGAGAGLALSHEVLFRSVATQVESTSRTREASEERLKQQHSTVKLLVELTKDLRAGLAIRYLYKDISILGDPGLSASAATNYKTTMIGYGSGFAYFFGTTGGLSYSYFPPLRGKTEVYGEEFLVVEPGFITVDGFYSPSSPWRFGVSGKRWLTEIDERAPGTTAADNQTKISLYGLDVDQYLFPEQLIMIGADYSLSKDTTFKAAIGQETDAFNFRDLMRYNRIDIQGSDESHQSMRYNRIRAQVRFGNENAELELGLGLFSRSHDFPEGMNGGSYTSSGQEIFAIFGLSL